MGTGEVMMQESDKGRFMVAMNSMSVIFGTADMPKPKLQLFFEAVHDLSIEVVEQSVKEIIKNESRFPAPKVVREYANMLRAAKPLPQLPRYSFNEIAGQSEFGKKAIAAIKDLFDGKITKKEYLLVAGRLADESQDIALANYCTNEWDKITESE